MLVIEMLVDSVDIFEYLSVIYVYYGYNQIFIADEDEPKMTFWCPWTLGTYEWVVMPFGLKNVGETYWKVMNSIFSDYIETFIYWWYNH